MKKVLILAYDFPPYISVGGLRPYCWYKYLNEFGVYPIIITRQWGNKHGNHLDYIAQSESTEILREESSSGLIIKTPYKSNLANLIMLKYGNSKFKLIRKIISAYYEFTQFLFLTGPKSALYYAAKEYLKNNSVDAIVATGDPFILFNYASKLSKEFNIPWIADYRDPWSQKDAIQNNSILKLWHSFFEKKIIKSASEVTTVSDYLQIKISRLIKNKKFAIIKNGFDPEAVEYSKNIKQDDSKFSIALVGSVYDWHPLRSFLTVVSKFIKFKGEIKIEINFYGINLYGVNFSSDLLEIITTEFNNLLNYVVIHKKMSNNILMTQLATKNVMLLFNDYSFLGTKIYDYIGVKRTILLCYKNDAEANKLKDNYFPFTQPEDTENNLQENLINITNSGLIINDETHLYTALEKLYTEFTLNGYVECYTINEENYSRKHQVGLLAETIKEVSLRK